MSGAEDTSTGEASWDTADAPSTAAAPRSRLFRKYALLFIALVGAALLVTSAFDFWFSYRENKAALVRVQQEKAQAAAARIEEFIDEIERQIGWTTHAQWAAAPLDQRRQDYFRLQRQVPAITELTELDGQGKEQLTVSRLKMDVIGSESDLSQTPAFKEAKAHRVWFSPVYFRKQSEPYMTLAIARDGRNAGVTVAEINLKLIWDVITALKIGEQGYAYVVDRRGKLIAHPDISLVLRDTDLSRLPQVATALAVNTLSPTVGEGRVRGSSSEMPAAVTVAKNLAGRAVLTAHAAIQPLGWLVFVEVPLKEAFAPLYGAAMRTALLLLFGLVAAALVALVLARRMTGPIQAIAAGAARLGAGELDRRIDVHTGDELETLAGQFNRMAGDLQKSYAELEQRVADRTAELSEALEQQTATAEVLGVINSSPGDLQPVFEAILEKAHRLCGVASGALQLYDGEKFRAVATHGLPEPLAEWLRDGLPPGASQQRVVTGEADIIHIADLALSESPRARHVVEIGGVRTLLYVALRKDQKLLGVISASRFEVRPFSEKEIALLQNFAAQAVIAMENARLITETREALEQQTATAEVLGVINSSPGDLTPVFEAILDKAMELCEAAFGSFITFDGEYFHAIAHRGVPVELVESLREPGRPTPGGAFARLIGGEAVVHLADIKGDDAYRAGFRGRVAMVDIGGARTAVWVALRKDETLLGAFVIYRQEVQPFSDKQLALLQNFAAQAVIAMENARLITETREALEQQTATAEVLGVINSSPGDLAPVFDAILGKAHELCGAELGVLLTFDGERFWPIAAHGASMRFREATRGGFIPRPENPFASVVAGEPVVHIPDLCELAAHTIEDPELRIAVEIGIRTFLIIPLRKDGQLLGAITANRRDVRPFSDKQIALLQNFAAQAVIAMENARLMTETREALEQQTATAEVLGVINSSPGDLTPVFEAMLEKATELCDAPSAILWTLDGERFHAAAMRGVLPKFAAFLSKVENTPSLQGLRHGEPYRHLIDAADDELYRRGDPIRRAFVDLGGGRTALLVPLRKDDALLGGIRVYRQEVRPFTEKQIALLQNFAAQAVIAMENARLLTETRERTQELQESLEIQTAISDVLRVISGSAFDLEPVLQSVVTTAIRLCRADHAAIFRNYDGEFRWAAGESLPSRYEEIERELRVRPGTGSAVGRAALEGRPVHIIDAWNDPLYELKEDARTGGVHTLLGVPLLRDGAVIGVIGLARQRVEGFTEKQIELVATFADQAVIAIENARLLGELRSRTDELARSVEELKALSEVGQAVSSTLDLRGVLSTILNRSVDLSHADAGAIFRYRRADRTFRFVEAVGYNEAMVQDVRALDVGENITGLGIAVANRAPLQIPDLRQRPPNPLRDQAIAAGYRSVLIVPLVGANRIMGATVLQRRAVGEFPEATVRLMQTLAAQSVLAIQNARLFREIAEKSEELRQASLHKSQFLANMSHELRTPLNAILGYAELLADGIYGELTPRAAGVLERVQNNGRHLLALINDVLDLSKIEAGQLVLTLEDYALPDVVQSVVSATESLAHNKGLTFTADIAPGLPPGHGDARRLAQVLLNLTGNAIKFTDSGEVAVGAAAEDGHFVLTVRDTGPGIAAADQGKIFEEFQQVDNSNTRKKGGTGLGLAISKRMVEMQGGTISVESELGHGATFRVTLPIRVEEVPEELMGAA